MSRNTLLGAACLLLVGLLIGYIAGSGGPSLADIDRTVTARIDAANQAQADRVAALETQVADLGGRVDAIGQQVKAGTDAVQGLGDRLGTNLTDLGTKLGDLGTKLGDSVSAAGASSIAALQSGLDKLQQRLTPAPAAPAAAPAAEPQAAAAPAAEPEAAAPTVGATDSATASGEPAGSQAGATVMLAGPTRVFISRVNDSAGEAVVYVNGARTAIKVGETAPFKVDGQDCRLTLAAIDRGHVTLDADCS